MTQQQLVSQQGILKCSKCGEGHDPGTVLCTKCNAYLRPTILGVVTILGSVVLGLESLRPLALIGRNPIYLVILLINIAWIVTLISLQVGEYWAWVAVQIVMAINIAAVLVVDPSPSVVEAVGTLSSLLFWIYLHTDRVKAFCSVGKRNGDGKGVKGT
ncbi:MAG: hypothetical protein HZA13_05095 [Nitrospirae bacterium]|nr:hypothetical protein [Nitrospirota bacterium]